MDAASAPPLQPAPSPVAPAPPQQLPQQQSFGAPPPQQQFNHYSAPPPGGDHPASAGMYHLDFVLAPEGMQDHDFFA